ncbi:UDP-N-acetylmuramate dehydrogenase [Frigoribacterium sp. PhB160]|uniref:UDP-N-acetylmuramate dehydrogenase n=1 Tax=Frigoribacterium sp. PhB160 TaxID=2485192 RepID=UPI000FB34A63|nr:UDP-N-acetylmuramate dehydrogenase [Frigoribacterium sp. PhB160]ROS61675.1 UDP-N-acetylmuramate dehydrogenase [Frigoribacterium sp. PhB160]
MTSFADLTTMRVGGEPARLVEPETTDELLEAVRAAWADGDEWFVLGGGSNTLASDEPYDGTVVRVATRGVERLDDVDGRVRLRVAAGEPWEDLVALTVAEGWSGLEALSGIPGSTGASPVQNIGAYGQEVASTLASVDFLDDESGEFVRLPASSLGLGYRTSVFKQGRRGVVTAVEFSLRDDGGVSEQVSYPQLASALGVMVGARVPVADVRERVLELRASKGMVLDDGDADTTSCGSFFTNPVVPRRVASELPTDAPRWPTEPEAEDRVVPLGEEPAAPPPPSAGTVKLSAAWLIEHAGVARGFRLPGSGAAVSSKHTLALTNRGSATAEDVVELARFVQQRVASEFGVVLHPEPVLLGLSL